MTCARTDVLTEPGALFADAAMLVTQTLLSMISLR